MHIFTFSYKRLFEISLIAKFCFIIIIKLFFINSLFSQTYPFRHFTVEDGLPSSETYHVFQDSKGYIWIATDNGISRYDGYEFKNYTTEDGLPDNTVFEIFEDYKNKIWFVPHSAKLSYFFNDSIYKYEFNDSLQSRMLKSSNPSRLSFYVDSSSNVIYSDKKNGAFKIDSIGNIKKLISTNSCSLLEFEKKLIYNKYKGNTNKLTYIKLKKNDTLSIQKYISPLHRFTDCCIPLKTNKNILISDQKILFNINEELNLSTIKYPESIIWISKDNTENIWIGTRNGVFCHINNNFEKSKLHLLPSKNISSVLKDNEDGYWFTTLYNGVFYLPNIFIKNLDAGENLNLTNINSISSGLNNQWLSYENSIYQIKSNQFLSRVQLTKDDIISNKLLFENRSNKLWILSRYLYSYRESILTKYLFKVKSIDILGAQPKDIIFDNNNEIWVGSSKGLFQYNPENSTFNLKEGLTQKINAICQKQNDAYILCGLNNGLWKYSIKENSFIYLGNKNELLKTQIDCIISNKYHNNIWLGTKSNGIVVYDNNEVYNISTKDGLSHNSITSLFQKENVIWVTTINGLNRITLQDKSFKHTIKIESFYKLHGLASNEINDVYVSDSLAYVATKKGLSIIEVNKIKKNNFPPPVFIKKITIQDKDTTIKEYYKLPYNRNSIRVEFVGLMYKNNTNKKYKYQFGNTERNKQWIEIKENYVKLSYLSPGKYSFKVIAINEDNIESIEPASIIFTIKPPFWKTWWFITFGILIISLILSILYKSRINEINKRNNLEKKLLKEVNKFRQKTLSQQMNPHFIFNTLNSIQYYIYDNDIDSSTKYLSKFSTLMRLILDNSQHDTISIQRELDTLRLYLELESVRLAENFTFAIYVNKDVNTEMHKIYPLLIQPFVENSIWHGLVQKGEKKIRIDIEDNIDSIMCKIEDNGIGRKKAMEIKNQQREVHKSHGTRITGDRIETINKLYNRNFKVEYIDLQDEIGNSKGTRVLLQIPKILH